MANVGSLKTWVARPENVWMRIFIGIVMILASIYAYTHLEIAVDALSIVLGVVVLLQGGYKVWCGVNVAQTDRTRALLAICLGIVLLAVAALLIIRPTFVTTYLAYIVAAWFVFDAVRNLADAYQLRHNHPRFTYVSLVLNVLLILAAILMVVNPGQNPSIQWLSTALLIGIALSVDGVDYIVRGVGDLLPARFNGPVSGEPAVSGDQVALGEGADPEPPALEGGEPGAEPLGEPDILPPPVEQEVPGSSGPDGPAASTPTEAAPTNS